MVYLLKGLAYRYCVIRMLFDMCFVSRVLNEICPPLTQAGIRFIAGNILAPHPKVCVKGSKEGVKISGHFGH